MRIERDLLRLLQMMRWRRLAIVILIAAPVAAGWWYRRPSRVPINVVLVTLDTTRADRLSPYGFMGAVMPGLDELAREAVVFDQAYTVAPLTLPAHTSLFTGLLPPNHSVRDNGSPPLAAHFTTLAEVLRDRGYCTGAFVSSVVLDPDRGLAQGFDRYDGVLDATRLPQRRADEVMDDAIRWLDEERVCPMFLWAHLYDAHRPYDPPEPFRSRHFDPYLGEIAFAESQLTRLLGALRTRRLLDNTLVVVVADHGESLGEHGEENHGMLLYESVLRVPLIVRLPRHLRASGAAGARVGDVVRLTDVMPTILDVLGIDSPGSDGVSLVGAMNGQRLSLDAYAESTYPLRFGASPLRMLRDDRFKLIDAPSPEFYDLAGDPFERRNIHADRQLAAEGLRRRLSAIGHGSAPTSGSAAPNIPPDVIDRLRALGYASPARSPNR
jgi:arylsulfatase A-like enzyme